MSAMKAIHCRQAMGMEVSGGGEELESGIGNDCIATLTIQTRNLIHFIPQIHWLSNESQSMVMESFAKWKW